MTHNKNQISAKTLLDSIVEFIEMTPELDDWSFEKQKDNPPRLIRLQQIDVMLKKLMPDFSENSTLKKKILSVYQGAFIKERKIEVYNKVFEEMDAFMIINKKKRHKHFEWALYHLQRNYTLILEYKKELRKMKNFASEYLEISYPYEYSNLLIGSIANLIDTSGIDHFLASVIDPFNQVLNKATLIKNDDYPAINLKEVDKDWV